MADHMQQQLMSAVQTALLGATDCGASVYADRPEDDALQTSELPALLVQAMAEDVSSVLTMARPYRQRREFSIRITAAVKQVAGYGAAVRQIGKQVELAMAGNTALNALATQVPQITRSEYSSSAIADKPVALLSQLWVLPYFTLSNQPDASV